MRPPIVFISFLAGLTTAALVPPRLHPKSTSGFSVPVSKTQSSKRDFVRDWAAARQKWGKGIPNDVLSAFSLLDDDGLVDVQPLGSDDIYIADVQIGNPPQTLKIAIDTGSADMWYKPDASNTSRRMDDAEWAVEYMDGTHANGIVYLDTVRLGGFELTDTAVQSAQIIASRFEREIELSGIMGFAKSLPSNIEPPTPSLLDKLRPHLETPVFSVDLRRNATGTFDFGHIDTSRASDNITWLDANPASPHWDVTFDLTAWDGSHRVWWAHSFEATIDTGTTLLFLPASLAGMYWFDVPGMRVDPRLNNAFTFPCHLADGLPDLMFKLPGEAEHVLTIPGSYLNYGPIDDDPEYCWGGMQSAEDLEVTIFGDVMLKALFVVFDLENNRVGFANKHLDDE
ncbi:aspartic peptidase domain-containing protein [Ilyonectria robusta]|uniref:aspartic peptidase domain-containing protein n=1 Tax=Ilyonectria robusta TaxID=1079257 RepID=UPI001E8D01CF|nr:aspartic peptidase domain-containing protein [Ilyonectria robusta]KAH8694689.1 aspartic peptidase domain-containing protein [Ilyonectria robusta]